MTKRLFKLKGMARRCSQVCRIQKGLIRSALSKRTGNSVNGFYQGQIFG